MNYTVRATTTSTEAGMAGHDPVVVTKEFEIKYDAIKWAWLVLKHRDVYSDLGNVEHVSISSNMEDDDWYFDAHEDDNEMAFIKLLAAENPQATALED